MAEQAKSKATKNEVSIVGYVLENKLSLEKDKKNHNVVKGSVVVKYGEEADDQVEASVYVGEVKANGDINKRYAEMVTLNSSLVSVATATEEKPASVISIYGNGNFAPKVSVYDSVYKGELNSRTQIQVGMATMKITDRVEPKDFCGNFDMDIFLTAKPMRQEDDTLKVVGLFVTEDWNTKATEVHPVTFKVYPSEVANGIEDTCEKGDTINVWGKTKVATSTKITKKTSGFGGATKDDKTTTTINELEITGGNPIDEDAPNAISKEFVKKALVERESMLENKVKNADAPAPKKTSGFGGGGISTASGDPKLKF